jgi:transcriptional regulator with XRE-family HTH domain
MKRADVTWPWIAERCHEDGDCLIWDHKKHRGQPVHTFQRGESGSIRKLAWKAAGKRELRENERVTMMCGHKDCLEPSHMRAISQAEVLKRNCDSRSVKLRKYAAVTESIRKARAKITLEDARYARKSDKTLAELSDELGISIQRLSKIRRGEAWPDPNPLTGIAP